MAEKHPPQYSFRPATGQIQPALLDFYDFLRACPGLDFIFVGRDDLHDEAIDGVGPDLAAVPALLLGAFGRANIAGHLAKPRQVERQRLSDADRDGMIDAIEARVEDLNELQGVEFALLWNVAGDADTHLDHSPGLSLKAAVQELIDCAEFELQSRKTRAEEEQEAAELSEVR